MWILLARSSNFPRWNINIIPFNYMELYIIIKRCYDVNNCSADAKVAAAHSKTLDSSRSTPPDGRAINFNRKIDGNDAILQ